MNSVLLHQYSVLVDFLAGTLGTDYEVTLDDLSRKNPCRDRQWLHQRPIRRRSSHKACHEADQGAKL